MGRRRKRMHDVHSAKGSGSHSVPQAFQKLEIRYKKEKNELNFYYRTDPVPLRQIWKFNNRDKRVASLQDVAVARKKVTKVPLKCWYGAKEVREGFWLFSLKECWEVETHSTGDGQSLYHGTKGFSVAGIVAKGFLRELSGPGMLGKGVYLSPDLGKALCFTLGGDQKEHYVLLCKVKLGQVFRVSDLRSWREAEQYDSLYVPAGLVRRAEYCVRDPSRILVTHIGVFDRKEAKDQEY